MKKAKYTSDLPRRLYTYFAGYSGMGAPSLSKFARESGVTHADLLRFREKYGEFRRACEECSEIRRDYLIDNALSRRFDPSMVKFLLSTDGEIETDTDTVSVRLEVIE